MKLKIGVIGVGHLGFHHTRVLSQLDSCELVGIYDIDMERARSVASQWDTKAYSSPEELIKEVDAISCVVPTVNHHDVGKMVLEHGKHLFLEKPMARTIEEAEELIKLAKEKGVKLQIGHIERFNPALLAVKDQIHDPHFIESHRLSQYSARSTDVDVVLDLMIHDIDLTLFFMGKEPVRIDGAGVPILTDTIDVANARLEFDRGEIANLTASRAYIGKKRKIRIFQPDAYISINLVAMDVEIHKKIDSSILPFFPDVNKRVEPLRIELESFIDAIRFDRRVEVSGEDGLRALRIAFKVIQDIDRRLKLSGILQKAAKGATP